MSFTLVQSKIGSVGSANASSVTISSSSTSAGNLLVAFVTVQGATVTITAPSGWSQIGSTQGVNGGTGSIALFYYQNNPGGLTSHVFSFSASCNAAVAFEEWSGVATSSALDQYVVQQNPKQTGAPTGNTAALAGSGELAIWGLGVWGTSLLTYSSISNGYSEDTSANASSSESTQAQATLFYNTNVGSAATSSGATMSGTGGAGNTTILAVFKPAAATNPALSTSPTSLSFSATVGGANPASQNATLSETNGVATAWTSSISYGSGSGWLSISPSSGNLGANGTQIINVSCATGSLSAGIYTATITFTASSGGATASISVTFTVAAPTTAPASDQTVYTRDGKITLSARDGKIQLTAS